MNAFDFARKLVVSEVRKTNLVDLGDVRRLVKQLDWIYTVLSECDENPHALLDQLAPMMTVLQNGIKDGLTVAEVERIFLILRRLEIQS